MNRKQRLRRIVYLDTIAKIAKAHADQDRAALREEAVAELAGNGSVPTWRFPKVGRASLAMSKDSAAVVDDSAFSAWVLRNHGTEVEVTIRPSFRRYVLDAVKTHGGILDDATGAVEEVPGVEITPGGKPQYVAVTPDTELRAEIEHEIAERLAALGVDLDEIEAAS